MSSENFSQYEQCVPQLPVSNPPVSQSTGQQSSPGAIARPAVPASVPSFSYNFSDPEEERKLIQQHVFLLWHAQRCPSEGQCPMPHCQTIKQVLSHTTSCSAGETCPVPHCSSSRGLRSHWKNCTWYDCPTCSPLKNAILMYKEHRIVHEMEHMKI